MRGKIFILSIFVSSLTLSASVAMACGCGKKGGAASCSQQCSASCGVMDACGGGENLVLAQNVVGLKVEKSELNITEVGNKICPVSGDKVPASGEKGAMGEVVKYEYNGKIYNLCCPMCVKDFKKDPEKYSKIADDEVKNASDEFQK